MPLRQRQILILLVLLTAISIALFGSLAVHPEAQSPDDLRLAPSAPAYLRPEILSTYGWWITLANGYAATYMVALTGYLPKFEPALRSIDDPRLRGVPLNPLAAVIIAGVVLYFIWFIFLRENGFGRAADRISLPHRRTALLILLAAACVAIWIFGGLTFSLLIVPAAWLWIFVEPQKSRAGRAAAIALSAGGLVPFILAFFLLGNGLSLWHLILAAGYTVIFPFDALMFLLMVALGIRFFRLGGSAPYVDPQMLSELAQAA
jgi:hypothetical protein